MPLFEQDKAHFSLCSPPFFENICSRHCFGISFQNLVKTLQYHVLKILPAYFIFSAKIFMLLLKSSSNRCEILIKFLRVLKYHNYKSKDPERSFKRIFEDLEKRLVQNAGNKSWNSLRLAP